ncbi:lipoprotein-anchoring transpeptidase ErfK/SrfK [Geodermatophilus daqingensis]|uniref:Lipoprotein-anchoring transpeptidase ErfK/SrfK n=1 Tax=Petropleomorpha daqingensis TaxID=2026353 RepID=A0A853CHG2_9ACTN|nr:lipoprotein-anchoring transpeptidase ErfK/SrfK [Petropleomorpha daqingensis]
MIAGALLLLAGCNDGAKSGSDASGSSSSSAPAAPAQVAVSPADGATDVSPVEPLEITVTGGRLADVTVVDAAGNPVTGTAAEAPADAAATSSASSSPSSSPSAAPEAVTEVWTPDAQLSYGSTYTLTATATNADDKEAKAATTFTTVTPQSLSTPSIGPLNGMTVGVGLPIRVYFDDPVADKAAVESHLLVTSSQQTDGVWSWVNDAEVHFRPSTYWPADTDVTLNADLYGVNFGDGVWGEKNRTVSFHVGPKHVSVADAGAHTLTVYDGDQVVQTFPMSAGSNANPTRNGVHVVTEMNRSMVMDSSTFGLAVDAPGGYRADVEYATRISNNGEFVHAAPWSVGSQGHANVSHGCINLSTDRAAWFFNFSQPGDVVEVKNSIGPQLSRADGDIFDWTISWEDWKAGSALK